MITALPIGKTNAGPLGLKRPRKTDLFVENLITGFNFLRNELDQEVERNIG